MSTDDVDREEPAVENTTLALRNVTVAFGGVVALNDVTLEIKGPGITAVVGPNGSGKSTAMGVLTGLIRPTSGSIELNGRNMKRRSSLAFARAGVRRSFQQVRLIPNITIWDNLFVGVQRPRTETVAHALELAESFGLVDYLTAWPRSVPAGVQRLVQVASVLVAKPSVVILDEPAAGLTDQEAGELANAVRIAGRQALTVVVEHNMSFIYSLADRVVVLLTGNLALDGDVSTVREDPIFQAAYLGIAAEDSTSTEAPVAASRGRERV
jgi:ABC-type branched-subunit amino acid transport system ATPase component